MIPVALTVRRVMMDLMRMRARQQLKSRPDWLHRGCLTCDITWQEALIREVPPSSIMMPSHRGSTMCESGSLASGGNNSHCTCDTCF